ncbi:MAG: FAD:protein FMN transferase [Bacteroidaceae bacterium]|nr:FAD:protein FMN transferase [Bacteroidaceae bacterium]
MNSKLSIWKILFLIFLFVGTIYIIRNQKPYITNSGKIFGTYYKITYKSETDLHEIIKQKMSDVDNSLSPFNKKSIITAINNNCDTTVNEMFTHVFTLAQEISEQTNGAFDITVAPLVNAWGFGFKKGTLPDSTTVDSLRRYIGYNTLSLNNGKITKLYPETMLDCSAIAKGYGCDAVATLLEDNGIADFMVEIGGEVVTRGKNDKGSNWAIGISKPNDNPGITENELQDIISISGKSMATSGNYRNFRYENGKKYSHTISPATGYPVEHSLLSATVIADDCATADALATAFMVMGKDKALEFCRNNENIEGYFIYANKDGRYKTAMSSGFGKYLRK